MTLCYHGVVQQVVNVSEGAGSWGRPAEGGDGGKQEEVGETENWDKFF